MFAENAFTYKEIIKKAIYYFGGTIQKVVAIEELSELQKAIAKSIRHEGTKTFSTPLKEERIRTDIIEEMADVYICLDQLKEMFNIDDDSITFMKEKKIGRLNDRLNGLIQETKKENGLDL